VEALRSHFPAPPRRLELSHRSLQRGSKDERRVTTACPQPAVTNGPQRPTGLEGQTHAQLILARRTTLHQRPNTFAQTCLLDQTFPLQSPCGPYIRNRLISPRLLATEVTTTLTNLQFGGSIIRCAFRNQAYVTAGAYRIQQSTLKRLPNRSAKVSV
jgi:hypothetical protein